MNTLTEAQIERLAQRFYAALRHHLYWDVIPQNEIREKSLMLDCRLLAMSLAPALSLPEHFDRWDDGDERDPTDVTVDTMVAIPRSSWFPHSAAVEAIVGEPE